VLTVLLAVGIVVALLTRTALARLALALFAVFLLLYFGRATWGPLADLLPLHQGLLYHRFIGGVDVAAIMLIGLAGDWIWRTSARLPRFGRPVAVGVLAVALMLPALLERSSYYAQN